MSSKITIWKSLLIVLILLCVSGQTCFGASQDFKGTINGNTITAGTGTVTISPAITIIATQNSTLDDTVALSKKANLETANSFTNVAPMTTIAEAWIGPSSTAGIYFKGGKIGAGSTNPLYNLDIIGARAAQVSMLHLGASVGGSAIGDEVSLDFTWQGPYAMGRISGYGQDANAGTGGLKFYTSNAGNQTYNVAPSMTLDKDGNVGIGTTTIPSMLTVAGLINMKNYTVATLPAGTRGDIAYVTDALAPTFLATIVGGGAVVTPVFFDGATWKGF